LRIVLNGPVASGKTTLGKAIAQKYGIPFIEEGLIDIFKAKHIYYEMRKNKASADEIDYARRCWIKSFFDWKDKRAQLYRDHREFVADRWDADLLDIWLYFWGREPHVDHVTQDLFRNLHEKSKSIDLVVLLPFGEPFTLENSSQNLRRNTRFTVGLFNWAIINGLIRSVANLNVLNIPSQSLSVGERLQCVDERIRLGF